MSEVIGATLISVIFLVGVYLGGSAREQTYNSLIQVNHEQLAEMKKECEKSLPRDKVCKAEVKFVVEE